MSAAARFRVVRQLTRVSGSADHSNTHCEPATVVMREASVEVSIPLELENLALVDRWASAPRGVAPEEQLLPSETQAIITRAIEVLPLAQREVITLRDIEGWSAADVCNALGLTETNQRVLLHRARSKVRAAVEPYLSPTAQR